MATDFKTLKKSEKYKYAEKHLQKYLSELKRHFDFSEFQVVHLLDIVTQNLKKKYTENCYSKILRLFFHKK